MFLHLSFQYLCGNKIIMTKILVIQQKRIGDVLVSSILCETLAKAYPDARIDYLIHESTFPVLKENTSRFCPVFFDDKKVRRKRDLFKFAMKIRRERYDIIIDSYSKMESWVLVALSGAKKRISFQKKGIINFLYTDLVVRHQNPTSNLGLTIERRLKLLEPLNIPKQLYVTQPKINITDQENKQALQLLEKHKLSKKYCVMINILGSRKSKTYPAKYMAKIVDCVAKHTGEILFNYIPNQTKEAEEIFNLCLPETQSKTHLNIIAPDIRSFLALMNNCRCIIGNDGGAINMAKAIGKASFIIFSPHVDKKEWATFEDGYHNVSVHLNDFYPELLHEKSKKKLVQETESLYAKFQPEFFLKQIDDFCRNHLK